MGKHNGKSWKARLPVGKTLENASKHVGVPRLSRRFLEVVAAVGRETDEGKRWKPLP